ncbi:MAG: hypothetical protein PHD32_01765 [Eubacteriales bacterium]|nr:hypothetical protein [Eubacteriales bacterium]
MKKKIAYLAAALAVVMGAALALSGCSAADPAASDEYYEQKLAIVNAINKSAAQGQFYMELRETLDAAENPDSYDGMSDCTTVYWYEQQEGSYFYRHSYTNNYNQSVAYAVGDGATGKFYGLSDDGKVDISKSLGKPLTAVNMMDLYSVSTQDEYATLVERVDTQSKGDNTVYTLVINTASSDTLPEMMCYYSYEVTPDGLLAGFTSRAEGTDEQGVAVVMKAVCTVTYSLTDAQKSEMEALRAQLPE